MNTTLFLKNYDKLVDIGINPEEQGVQQTLRFNIEVLLSQSADQDAITSTTDYCLLITAVETAITQKRYNLLETLGQRIIEFLKDVEEIETITVTITKRDILPADAELGIRQCWVR